MKDALKAMTEAADSDRSVTGHTCTKCGTSQELKQNGPPKKYEKIIQKLEGDIRGHIRVSLIGL
jgi:hypothetical protein